MDHSLTERDAAVGALVHPFEAFDGATGATCTAMVMRDGGGDACGRPPADPIHGHTASPAQLTADGGAYPGDLTNHTDPDHADGGVCDDCI